MKIILVSIAICLALVQCEENVENGDIQKLGADVYIPNAGQIKTKIENLRDGLKATGMNDYKFENVELPVNSEALGISANIKATGEVKGLLDFDVQVSGAIFSYNFDVTWTGPIEVNIEPYDLRGFVHMIEVYGKGKLSLVLDDLAVKVNTFLGIWPGDKNAVVVKRFTLQAIGFTHKVELTGWLNDEIRSKMITNFVNHNLKPILDEYDNKIKTTINKVVTDLLQTVKIPI